LSKSEIEELLASQFIERGWKPRRNYRFNPMRKFEADFAWPKKKILVEVQGGIWSRKGAKRCPVCGQTPRGRHIMQYDIDCEKLNLANMGGWRMFWFTTKMVKDKTALYTMERVLEPGNTARKFEDIKDRMKQHNRKD
jgi:very-short-patch-repair endonuclease